MFSLASVCSRGAESHVIITHDTVSMYTKPPPNMLKLLHYEARTVGKRAIGIVPESFLDVNEKIVTALPVKQNITSWGLLFLADGSETDRRVHRRKAEHGR